MDRAAKGGFLDVLKFLVQEGQQCTTVRIHMEDDKGCMERKYGNLVEGDAFSKPFPVHAGDRLHSRNLLRAARYMQTLVFLSPPKTCTFCTSPEGNVRIS